MADTVLESLEKEIDKAFQKFALRPTQSARVQLRHELLTIAGALDVEAANLETADAMTLRIAITDLRTVAETVLVAPVDALILESDRPVAPAPKPVVPPKPKRSFVDNLLGMFNHWRQ